MVFISRTLSVVVPRAERVPCVASDDVAVIDPIVALPPVRAEIVAVVILATEAVMVFIIAVTILAKLEERLCDVLVPVTVDDALTKSPVTVSFAIVVVAKVEVAVTLSDEVAVIDPVTILGDVMLFTFKLATDRLSADTLLSVV